MTRFNFYLPDNLKRGLEALDERDEIKPSEAIRRAIEDFLKKRGIDTSEKGATKKRSK